MAGNTVALFSQGDVFQDDNPMSLACIQRSSCSVREHDVEDLQKAALEKLYGPQIAAKKAVIVPQPNGDFKVVDLTKLSKDDKALLFKKYFPAGHFETSPMLKVRERLERYCLHPFPRPQPPACPQSLTGHPRTLVRLIFCSCQQGSRFRALSLASHCAQSQHALQASFPFFPCRVAHIPLLTLTRSQAYLPPPLFSRRAGLGSGGVYVRWSNLVVMGRVGVGDAGVQTLRSTIVAQGKVRSALPCRF